MLCLTWVLGWAEKMIPYFGVVQIRIVESLDRKWSLKLFFLLLPQMLNPSGM